MMLKKEILLKNIFILDFTNEYIYCLIFKFKFITKKA